MSNFNLIPRVWHSGSAKTKSIGKSTRLHFGNKKTFLPRAHTLTPELVSGGEFHYRQDPDISTLKSFQRETHRRPGKLTASIRYDLSDTLSYITKTLRYFSLCTYVCAGITLFLLTFRFFQMSTWYYFSFSGCSCVVYSSSDRPQGGIFTSPNFPKRYPPNIDCLLYTFIGHPDEIIALTFHQFNIRRIWPE